MSSTGSKHTVKPLSLICLQQLWIQHWNLTGTAIVPPVYTPPVTLTNKQNSIDRYKEAKK